MSFYFLLREQPNRYDASIGTVITAMLADGLSGLRSDFLWMKHPNRSDALTPQSVDAPHPREAGSPASISLTGPTPLLAPTPCAVIRPSSAVRSGAVA